ncbi:hypothetical protein [Massilibacteroides sp.]|uniref:hypothetical protein n=1 Tax=Massilibacteroides sp. TaxID=2034766 RepID=UPI00261117D3|nr:hypothetical protein [Massilibacteroides sp.]MDD4515109.1 hypothetical protein [Massilibacteroides sp.]
MNGAVYIRNKQGKLIPITTIKGDPGVSPELQMSELGYKTWWVYSNILNDYVDTGVRAEAILHIEDGVIIFTESSERVNIASGEAMSIVLGKIKKWLSDLKAISFSGSYDDLSNKPSIPSKVSDLTNDSGYQSADQVNAAISNLVNGSPAALDTLQELATALGNDPNFATTVSNLIGTKAKKSVLKSATLTAANWVATSDVFSYTISDAAITSDAKSVVFTPATLADREKGQDAGLLDYAEASTGSLTIYSEEQATENISINYLISF